MKLLVLEFITGGGMLNQSVSESLFHEGNRMLQSLLDDLMRLENIELIVLRDGRYPLPEAYYETMKIIEIDDNFQQNWLTAVQQADAVWPIAPETDTILQRLCFDVEQANKYLLNSDSATVGLTATKAETLQHLNKHQIDTVPTDKLTNFSHQWSAPWVIKPNDGAGCEACQLITQRRSFKTLLKQADADKLIIQPYTEGEPLSLSALFCNGSSQLFSINRQHIEIKAGYFHLFHCEVNALSDTDGRFQRLLSKIATALPGLWGYAGIDLILTPDRRILLLEINPRLTTSYCDLYKTVNTNPADRVIQLLNKPGTLNYEH